MAAVGQSLRVDGEIVGADGRPVNGAIVELLPYPQSYPRRLHELTGDGLPESVASGTTTEEGTYRLTVPGAGTWRLQILPQHRSLADQPMTIRVDLLPLLEDATLPTVVVPRVRRLGVEVVGSDASAIEGALVIAQPTLQVLGQTGPGRPSVVVSRSASRTDEHGRSTFQVPPGPVRLFVIADDHLLESRSVQSSNVVVELVRGEMTTIQVRGMQGTPVEHAIVRIGENLVPLAMTDEQGRARVPRPPGGEGSYQAESGDLGYGTTATFSVLDLQRRETLSISLEPPQRVSGRVVEFGNGEPIPGALVWAPQRPGDTTVADNRGHFSMVTWTTSRGLWLQADARGHVQRSLRRSLDSIGSGEVGEIALQPSQRLIGRVVDSQGLPVAQARVSAFAGHELQGFDRRSARTGSTGSAGRFELSRLPRSARYLVSVRAEGHSRLDEVVTLNETPEDLELTLRRGLRLLGTVVGSDDRPIAGATVVLLPPDVDSPAAFMHWQEGPAEATTDQNGRFTFIDHAAGSYDLHAEAVGHSALHVPGIEVVGDVSEVELGTLQLVAGEVLAGRVLDPSGQPLAGAQVELVNDGKRVDALLRRRPRTVSTGVEGEFVFDSLQADRLVQLEVRHDRFATVRLAAVRVPNDQVEIVVVPGAVLAGIVLDEGGRAVAAAHLSLYADLSRGRGFSGAIRPRTTSTDQAGRLEISSSTSGRGTGG